jgi:serine protease Do
MKTPWYILLPIAFLGPAWTSAESPYIDFKKRVSTFAENLGDILESEPTGTQGLKPGKTIISAVQVSKQLQPERSHKVNHLKPESAILSGEELYRKRLPSVVMIGKIYKCDRCDRWHANIATGFVIHRDGIVVTNYHVIETEDAEDAIGVQTHDGKIYRVEKVLASSQKNDLAILKIDATDLQPAPIAPGVDVGESVSVISHPVKHLFTYTEGTVSGKSQRRYRKTVRPQLTITADFAKGSSGAPIFDKTGAVVGIVRATETVYYDENRGNDTNPQMVWKFAIPSECLLELIE